MAFFYANCSIPPEGTVIVATPNIRGTLDILWNCLSVLLLSTWSILYLNVPPNSTPVTGRQKNWRMAQRFWSKVRWMTINILAPEYPLAKAWSDHCSVASFFSKYAKYEGEVPWTRAHVYLANMGGFGITFEELAGHNATVRINDTVKEETAMLSDWNEALRAQYLRFFRVEPPSIVALPDRQPSEQEEREIKMLEQSIHISPINSLPESVKFAIKTFKKNRSFAGTDIEATVRKASKRIGDIPWRLDKSNAKAVQTAARKVHLGLLKGEVEQHRFLVGNEVWFDNLHALQGDHWVLDAHQLLLVREMGILKDLPHLTKDELAGRSRSDILLVLLAFGQVLWFIVQCIARRLRNYQTTQLEIVTLAFAFCSCVTYFLLLEKPKDVQTTMFVSANRYATPEELVRIAVAGPFILGRKRSQKHSIWIPNNAIHWESTADGAIVRPFKQFSSGCASGLVVFGVAHCMAWDFHFPTVGEKLMWKIASLFSAATVPLCIGVLIVYWNWAETKEGRSMRAKRSALLIMNSFLSVFVVVRLYILVESVRSLAYLPSSAFLTTWGTDDGPQAN